MIKLDKKQFLNVSFILSAAAFLVAFTGLIAIIVSNGVPGYGMSGFVWFVLELVGALLCIAAAVTLSLIFKDKELFVSTLNLLALVFSMLAFGGIIMQRAILASAQFTYDSGNAAGWSALNSSIVTIAACFVSSVVLAVQAFMPAKKSSQN